MNYPSAGSLHASTYIDPYAVERLHMQNRMRALETALQLSPADTEALLESARLIEAYISGADKAETPAKPL